MTSPSSAPSRVSAAEAARLLEQFVPFKVLTADILAQLGSTLVERNFRLGQTLLEPDVLPTSVYCLLQGQLRVLEPTSGCRQGPYN